MAYTAHFPISSFLDVDGKPLENGYVYIGTAGLDPVGNQITVYWDAAATQVAAQPIRTIGGYPSNNGVRSRLYVAATDYSIKVTNVNGTDTVPVSLYNAEEFFAADIIFLQAGAGAVPRTVESKLRESVSVKDFGAVGNGVADDTVAIQTAINGVSSGTTIFFPRGTYKITSQLLISGKSEITLLGDRGSKLLFTDGNYIGLLFNNSSQRCKIENLLIWGTNNSNPAITLIKATANSAYMTIKDCNFAFASIAVLFAQSYIMKLIGNAYSNCDTYVRGTSAEGSTTDLLMLGETYGTSLIGTNALIDCDYIQTRIDCCYFETESHTKDSIYIRTGTQFATITGCQFSNSGRIRIASSNAASITGNTLRDVYSSSSSIRIDGGSNASITGNQLVLPVLVAGVFSISSSGRSTFCGNFVDKYATGISITDGAISSNSIINCTTGIAISVGQNVVVANDNEFSNNTTNITNSSSTAIAPGTFTGTLTGCTTSPTGSIRYEVNNGFVTLSLAGITGTSNTTACTITGLPTAIQPAGAYFGSAIIILDNGVQSVEQCSVSGGTLTLYKDGSATGFTNSGTKGIRACVIQYRLRNV